MSGLDSRELRRTLGAFTTGVTVVTTRDAAGKNHGVTANSFSSVSLDPPLILWSQSLASRSYPAFRDTERFVVNVMADDQVHVSNQFAKSGDDKFVGIATDDGLDGLPIIKDCAAHFECRKVAAYPGGDHIVYIGQIERMFRAARRPLAFGDGRYMVTFAHDLGGSVGAAASDGLAQIEAVRVASATLPDLCERIGQRTVGIAVWGNRGATMVRWEPSREPVSPYLQTGAVVSMTQSATGRAFSAFFDPEKTQPLVEDELNDAENAGRHLRSGFVARLTETRQHGLARSVGEAPSERHQVTVNAFSAPVFDARNRMVLALSTTCRADRLDPDWDGPVPQALLEAARDLSRRIGQVLRV